MHKVRPAFINTPKKKKNQSSWGETGSEEAFKAAFHMKEKGGSSVREKFSSGKRKAVIKGLSQCLSGIEGEHAVHGGLDRFWFFERNSKTFSLFSDVEQLLALILSNAAPSILSMTCCS